MLLSLIILIVVYPLCSADCLILLQVMPTFSNITFLIWGTRYQIQSHHIKEEVRSQGKKHRPWFSGHLVWLYRERVGPCLITWILHSWTCLTSDLQIRELYTLMLCFDWILISYCFYVLCCCFYVFPSFTHVSKKKIFF